MFCVSDRAGTKHWSSHSQFSVFSLNQAAASITTKYGSCLFVLLVLKLNYFAKEFNAEITELEKNPRQKNITEFSIGHPSPASLHTILLIERSMLAPDSDGWSLK